MASYMDRDNYGMYKDSEKHGPGPALMGADTLLGNDVVNGQDESLGDIKEFMIDMRSGNIAYAVLAFGGFLGMGEKLFAVPFQALQLDTENHRFVLNVPKERLQDAPGFDKDAWPDMTDVTWNEHIHEFYGTEPYSSQGHGQGLSGGLSGGMTSGAGAGTMGGAGMSSMGGGHAGSSSTGGSTGSGSSMSGSGTGRSGTSGGSMSGSSSGSGMSSQSGSGLGSQGNVAGSSGSDLSRQSGGSGSLGGSVLGDTGDVSGGGTSSSGRGLELGRDGELNPGTGSITDSNYQEKQ